jgi:hypothetical protein
MSKIMTLIFSGAALLSMGAFAQEPPPNPNQPPSGQTTAGAPAKNVANPSGQRRFFYGFRVEAFPLKQFTTSSPTVHTTNPVADYSYSAHSNSQKEALAGTFEYAITRHWSAGAEFYLTHATYVQTTTLRTGVPSPNSSTDDRPVTTFTQTTKANYWVLPVIARYYGIRRTGFLSHLYLLGGAEYRYVGRVRTGTDINYPDGTTGYNEIPAVPTNRNQIGALAGFGIRFFDQFGFKLTPEVRYIRWNNESFMGPGYASTRNQAEAGIGFSF